MFRCRFAHARRLANFLTPSDRGAVGRPPAGAPPSHPKVRARPRRRLKSTLRLESARYNSRAMSTHTVARVLVDGLRRMGTARIFGVPGGGSSLDLMDAARDAGLPFVLTHGETAACIMAAVTGELT